MLSSCSHGLLLICVPVSKFPFYRDSSHIGLGSHPTAVPHFQISSHSDALGVKTSVYEFRGTIQPITETNSEESRENQAQAWPTAKAVLEALEQASHLTGSQQLPRSFPGGLAHYVQSFCPSFKIQILGGSRWLAWLRHEPVP